MSAMLSTIIRPAEEITRFLVRRAAIAKLCELDDDALKDIGLARSEIEAAAYGRMTAYNRARLS
ncbi:DUF1127 domain-containing protein [Pararhizobium sp. BT-229]|uniref:DUF1127 domain-containing protein n=1 Tax=Pararhizobium sp. BT-229 TaxID=2986923 RepID=UPI0021F7A8DD|nr:DUF1127 domain-containing protein [Pararhizobium sp. BT-229]MCV9961999.1 DUF1127 domain-containing protein [Pararhizobium sp. BT-229]